MTKRCCITPCSIRPDQHPAPRKTTCVGKAFLQFFGSLKAPVSAADKKKTELLLSSSNRGEDCLSGRFFHQECVGRPPNASFTTNPFTVRADEVTKEPFLEPRDLRHLACEECLVDYQGHNETMFSNRTAEDVAAVEKRCATRNASQRKKHAVGILKSASDLGVDSVSWLLNPVKGRSLKYSTNVRSALMDHPDLRKRFQDCFWDLEGIMRKRQEAGTGVPTVAVPHAAHDGQAAAAPPLTAVVAPTDNPPAVAVGTRADPVTGPAMAAAGPRAGAAVAPAMAATSPRADPAAAPTLTAAGPRAGAAVAPILAAAGPRAGAAVAPTLAAAGPRAGVAVAPTLAAASPRADPAAAPTLAAAGPRAGAAAAPAMAAASPRADPAAAPTLAAAGPRAGAAVAPILAAASPRADPAVAPTLAAAGPRAGAAVAPTLAAAGTRAGAAVAPTLAAAGTRAGAAVAPTLAAAGPRAGAAVAPTLAAAGPRAGAAVAPTLAAAGPRAGAAVAPTLAAAGTRAGAAVAPTLAAAGPWASAVGGRGGGRYLMVGSRLLRAAALAVVLWQQLGAPCLAAASPRPC
ncbi:hypothetical protein PLESTM_002013300 [Pleodorina starrii]|nr:hypothetical protein PLESTM_002013300 [Pleodorina starrii]